ncbi:MAG: TOMM precursor leader peptide-binding protein [Acidobacteria bacterium]|nr:TOMM precursor leader peptide-binding protein [Acidobacteriota bacterium]
MLISRPAIKRQWQRRDLPDGRTLMFVECVDKYEFIDHNGSPLVLEILDKLDGTNDLNELIRDTANRYSVSSTMIVEFLQRLYDRGYIYDAAVNSRALDIELDRYSRQVEYFALYESDGITRFDFQDRLADSTIVILGLGGIGASVAQTLAAMGCGQLVIVDHDVVELHNLHRQFLYSEADVGTPKVAAAAAALRRHNSGTNIVEYQMRIQTPDELRSILEPLKPDLVISAVDEPLIIIRRVVAEACYGSRIPMMIAGGTEVGPIFDPPTTSCFFCAEDLMRRQLPFYEDVVRLNQTQAPVWIPALPTSIALIASLMSFEAVRFLTGYQPPQSYGAMIRVNTVSLGLDIVPISKSDECAMCGSA